MKHIYVICGWFSDIHRHVDLCYYSSLKKAEKSLKLHKETYKKHPEMGIKNPETDLTIRKELLF